MAGSFGLEAEHYDASMQMAELSLLPAVRAAAPMRRSSPTGFPAAIRSSMAAGARRFTPRSCSATRSYRIDGSPAFDPKGLECAARGLNKPDRRSVRIRLTRPSREITRERVETCREAIAEEMSWRPEPAAPAVPTAGFYPVPPPVSDCRCGISSAGCKGCRLRGLDCEAFPSFRASEMSRLPIRLLMALFLAFTALTTCPQSARTQPAQCLPLLFRASLSQRSAAQTLAVANFPAGVVRRGVNVLGDAPDLTFVPSEPLVRRMAAQVT